MKEFAESITKESTYNLPIERFEGSIFVIDTESQMNRAFEYLRTFDIVGIDTETRPSFKKGVFNEVALLQVSTDTQCFLFRLNILGISQAMLDFFSDENVLKIGLSLKDDIASLNRKKKINLLNFVDIQQYVKPFGVKDNSLMKIYAIIFGKRISKAQRLSNWEAPILTEKQIQYAALDAWATRRIYVELEKLQKI